VICMSADQRPDSHPSEEGASRTGLSTRAKAIVAALTAVVTLATGILTLRDQIFGGDESGGGNVADVTLDAEAKSRANRVLDGLKSCFFYDLNDYQRCATAERLESTQVPIGSGVGSVEVEATSPTTFDLTSRSQSGQVFFIQNFVSGEEVRTCTPRGDGGCPPDGRW
jgi:hypothetical protein